MIDFKDLDQSKPYKLFKDLYEKAVIENQKNVEAISISSFNSKKREVESRFVNIKLLKGMEFIFFSNYSSPKSKAFKLHPQISALFYWSAIDVQIRMKAKIKKTPVSFNDEYFKNRSKHKNALAISSNQSQFIKTYEDVVSKYNTVLETENLLKCPNYWGGYSFTPYYFEFWEGHESRINKREVFDKIDGVWKHSFLQP